MRRRNTHERGGWFWRHQVFYKATFFFLGLVWRLVCGGARTAAAHGTPTLSTAPVPSRGCHERLLYDRPRHQNKKKHIMHVMRMVSSLPARLFHHISSSTFLRARFFPARLLLTSPAHVSCSRLLLTSLAHASCSRLLLTSLAHVSCSRLLLTSFHGVFCACPARWRSTAAGRTCRWWAPSC